MYYEYLRFLFGIDYLAHHSVIKHALYQPLYPEFIPNCFDIKLTAAFEVRIEHGAYRNMYSTRIVYMLIVCSNMFFYPRELKEIK